MPLSLPSAVANNPTNTTVIRIIPTLITIAIAFNIIPAIFLPFLRLLMIPRTKPIIATGNIKKLITNVNIKDIIPRTNDAVPSPSLTGVLTGAVVSVVDCTCSVGCCTCSIGCGFWSTTGVCSIAAGSSSTLVPHALQKFWFSFSGLPQHFSPLFYLILLCKSLYSQ